jgi:hypothetical protein
MNNKVAVYRKEHFNAAHRLHNVAWDENQTIRFSVSATMQIFTDIIMS